MVHKNISLTVVLLAILALIVAAHFAPKITFAAVNAMTAVTVVRRRTNVAGKRKFRAYTISGNNNYTLDTRLRVIESVDLNANVANAPTAWTESTVNGYQTLTFTAGGAFTNAKIDVIGYS